MLQLRQIACVLLLMFAAACGCQKSGLPTFPATGMVTLPDGDPLPGGSVIFRSVDHGLVATGSIGSDGVFRLGTYLPNDGAVAGPHEVAIRPPMGSEDEGPTVPIGAKYLRCETSGLKFDVSVKERNDFRIVVTREIKKKPTFDRLIPALPATAGLSNGKQASPANK